VTITSPPTGKFVRPKELFISIEEAIYLIERCISKQEAVLARKRYAAWAKVQFYCLKRRIKISESLYLRVFAHA
jgi:hypothetical protein